MDPVYSYYGLQVIDGLQGCTIADRHTAEPQQAESEASKKQTITPNVTLAESTPTKEVYTTTLPAAQSITPARSPAPPTPVVEEEDDPSAPVNPGTTCRRKGCGVQFVSDEVNRLGDGDGTACQYHPSPVGHSRYSQVYLTSVTADFQRRKQGVCVFIHPQSCRADLTHNFS